MSRTKRFLLWVMAAVYVVAGFNHLLNPAFYLAIMPPGLPSPEWLNLLSGLAEIVLGVYVLEPRVRVLAAWGIIALLIAVYPANIHMALHPERFPDMTATALYLRLPLQFVFAGIVWWSTRSDPQGPKDSA